MSFDVERFNNLVLERENQEYEGLSPQYNFIKFLFNNSYAFLTAKTTYEKCNKIQSMMSLIEEDMAIHDITEQHSRGDFNHLIIFSEFVQNMLDTLISKFMNRFTETGFEKETEFKVLTYHDSKDRVEILNALKWEFEKFLEKCSLFKSKGLMNKPRYKIAEETFKVIPDAVWLICMLLGYSHRNCEDIKELFDTSEFEKSFFTTGK